MGRQLREVHSWGGYVTFSDVMGEVGPVWPERPD